MSNYPQKTKTIDLEAGTLHLHWWGWTAEHELEVRCKLVTPNGEEYTGWTAMEQGENPSDPWGGAHLVGHLFYEGEALNEALLDTMESSRVFDQIRDFLDQLGTFDIAYFPWNNEQGAPVYRH